MSSTSALAPIIKSRPPTVSQNPLKTRLRNGDTLYGIFLMTFSPTIAEISALAGYDFAVIDLEHGHGGISSALPCLHALAAANVPAILRVPELSPIWTKKALDLGPQGIMFPMIDGAQSAVSAVSYCRYPPAGVRGAAHPVIRASKYGMDESYINNCERDLFIICQVESVDAVKKAGVIGSVDGVDCVMIGPLDLSAEMGYLWNPGNEKVVEMMKVAEEEVLGRFKKWGVGGGGAYLGGFAMGSNGSVELKRRGYHFVCGAIDVGLYRNAVLEDVERFKRSDD